MNARSAFFALATCALGSPPCSGAGAFDGLEPGRSTRVEVERVYGTPLRSSSPTLVEYRSGREALRIFVQYRGDSPIVERVEKVSHQPVRRSSVLAGLSISPVPTASRVDDRGRRVEYYASGRIVLTFAGKEESSGVVRVARYSSALFAVAIATRSRSPQGGGGARSQVGACFASDPGAGALAAEAHATWARGKPLDQLQRNLASKIDLVHRCSAVSDETFADFFAALSVAIARAVPNPSCFGGDQGAVATRWNDHRAWARTRSRAELKANLTRKATAALACGNDVAALFGELSSAIAKGPEGRR